MFNNALLIIAYLGVIIYVSARFFICQIYYPDIDESGKKIRVKRSDKRYDTPVLNENNRYLINHESPKVDSINYSEYSTKYEFEQ
jgi:hypothetical protein